MSKGRRSYSTKLQWALWYAEHGIPVLPCRARTKEPLTAHGVHDATTDRNQIIHWFDTNPDANLAIATGTPSGLLVIDIDPRNGGDDSWNSLCGNHRIPKTPQQKTGGDGTHIFLNMPDIPVRSGKLDDGIDKKTDGGYVVVPPSVHPNGKFYRWKKGLRPDDTGFADAPDWLLAAITPRHSRRRLYGAADIESFAEGERNNQLTSLAGLLRYRGMSQSAIEAVLQVVNQEQCRPPLSDSEVRGIALSIARYEAGVSPSLHGRKGRDTSSTPWPAPLGSAAFYGVAGELVHLIEPHSEADPAALLLQTLVAVGNVFGRNACFRAEADLHFTNLYTVVVGLTAKGRKGTSLGHIKRIMAKVDADWADNQVMSGLSTGEGLIAALEDEKSGEKHDKRKQNS